MTANQLVAYNLRRAREGLGLTQPQAALLLEPYLGKRWSVASFSAAERSAEGGRRRVFSANELLAFACTFNKPIAWFFEPPPELKDAFAGEPLDVGRVVSRSQLLEATAGLALFDRAILHTLIASLRDALSALENLEQQSDEPAEAVPSPPGTVGFARHPSDEHDDNASEPETPDREEE